MLYSVSVGITYTLLGLLKSSYIFILLGNDYNLHHFYGTKI